MTGRDAIAPGGASSRYRTFLRATAWEARDAVREFFLPLLVLLALFRGRVGGS